MLIIRKQIAGRSPIELAFRYYIAVQLIGHTNIMPISAKVVDVSGEAPKYGVQLIDVVEDWVTFQVLLENDGDIEILLNEYISTSIDFNDLVE